MCELRMVETSAYTVRALDASTWPAFAALMEFNNGIFGDCWCMGFYAGGVGRAPPRQSRSRARFKRLHHMQNCDAPRRRSGRAWLWADVLGLAEVDKPPVLADRGGVWFRAGGVELHLGVEDGCRRDHERRPGGTPGNARPT